MPWTLYGYILREIIKVLIVCTVMLISVISFAVAIKFLSRGVLDPRSLLLFVLFLAPTFIGLILPFAGAFASTLVFHRMASENEVLACSASGMSYRAILAPVFFLGVVLTLSLFLMSNWVMPRFHLMSSSLLEKDITRVLVSQVQSGRAMELGDFVVYADRADDRHEPPYMEHSLQQPYRRIILQGVAVGRLDAEQRVRMDVTAEMADVLLYNIDNKTVLTMWLSDVTYYEPTQGQMIYNEGIPIGSIRVPSPLRDDPKFLSWPRLDRLREEPERYDRVNALRHTLIERLAMRDLLDKIETAMSPQRHERVTLLGPQPEEQFVITTPAVQRLDDAVVLQSRSETPVVVRRFVRGLPTLRIEARRAVIRAQVIEPLTEPELRIEFTDAVISDETFAGHRTQHREYSINRARWPEPVLVPLVPMNSVELIERVRTDPLLSGIREVQGARRRLEHGITALHREITAQLHNRATNAVASLFALLLGAVLSIRLKDRMPLEVYFWTFLLAMLITIIAYSGKNVATNQTLPISIGLAVTWMGTALIACVVAVLYVRICRN